MLDWKRNSGLDIKTPFFQGPTLSQEEYMTPNTQYTVESILCRIMLEAARTDQCYCHSYLYVVLATLDSSVSAYLCCWSLLAAARSTFILSDSYFRSSLRKNIQKQNREAENAKFLTRHVIDSFLGTCVYANSSTTQYTQLTTVYETP